MMESSCSHRVASKNTQVMIKAQMGMISFGFSSSTISDFILFDFTPSHIPILVPFVTVDGLRAPAGAAAATAVVCCEYMGPS